VTEYAAILALVTVVATAGYVLLGGTVAGLYEAVVTAFT
jgi:Flp pilus assembly pilin Flp